MLTGITDIEPAPSLATLVRDLGKDVTAIADKVPFVVDDRDVGAALCDLQAVKNQLAGLERELLAATEFSSILADSNQRTISQFVAARTNTRAAIVRRATRRTDWLRDFDLFRAEAAVISDEHIDYLRSTVDSPRTRRLLVRDQQIFVDIATHGGWKEFVTATEYWIVTNDPDGEEPAEQQQRSPLHLRKGRGGRLTLKGETDAITGQLLENAVAAEAEKIRRHDITAGVDRCESDRNMAALIALAERGAARQDGTYTTPLINVVISQRLLDWLMDQEAGLTDPTAPIPVDPDDPDGRCELIDGTPIHPHQVLPLLAKANIRRVVLDAKSRVLDVSYAARNFPEWIRTARQVETRGRCTVEGCDSPHRWLQTDHIVPHSRGGPTAWHNSQPYCRPDNHAKGNRTNLSHHDPPRTE